MSSAIRQRVVTALALGVLVIGLLMLLPPVAAVPVIALVFLAGAAEWAGFAQLNVARERALYVVVDRSRDGPVVGVDVDRRRVARVPVAHDRLVGLREPLAGRRRPGAAVGARPPRPGSPCWCRRASGSGDS
jgi:hypothetical protein